MSRNPGASPDEKTLVAVGALPAADATLVPVAGVQRSSNSASAVGGTVSVAAPAGTLDWLFKVLSDGLGAMGLLACRRPP
jgi:hypothetical protein